MVGQKHLLCPFLVISAVSPQRIPLPIFRSSVFSSEGSTFHHTGFGPGLLLQAPKRPWKRCAVLCLVAQLCLTLCDPMDCSPPGSSVHGDPPGKNTGVDCPCPPLGDLPSSGPEPRSPLQADSLPSEPSEKPKNTGVDSLALLQGNLGPTQMATFKLNHLFNALTLNTVTF